MESYDLVILMFGCYTEKKYKRQIEVINKTWGMACKLYSVKLLYFLGEEKRIGFRDTNTIKYINLKGVKNDYASASYKQFLGLHYVYEMYNAKFIFCAGTDTYINIPKMMAYLTHFSPKEELFIGGDGDYRQIGTMNCYFHAGGAGFIITQPCLEKLYPLLTTIMGNWITLCKENHVEVLIDSCDVAISFYLQNLIPELKIVTNDDYFSNSNHHGWPWRPDRIDMTKLITCHFMNEYHCYEFTSILHKNNYFLTGFVA
jgi:hypothetical protein